MKGLFGMSKEEVAESDYKEKLEIFSNHKIDLENARIYAKAYRLGNSVISNLNKAISDISHKITEIHDEETLRKLGPDYKPDIDKLINRYRTSKRNGQLLLELAYDMSRRTDKSVIECMDEIEEAYNRAMSWENESNRIK